MGTRTGALSNVLFSGSRRSILALLYGHPDEQFYLREIARRAGTGIGATQRRLDGIASVYAGPNDPQIALKLVA